jgi:hypothetical protein
MPGLSISHSASLIWLTLWFQQFQPSESARDIALAVLPALSDKDLGVVTATEMKPLNPRF